MFGNLEGREVLVTHVEVEAGDDVDADTEATSTKKDSHILQRADVCWMPELLSSRTHTRTVESTPFPAAHIISKQAQHATKTPRVCCKSTFVVETYATSSECTYLQRIFLFSVLPIEPAPF